MRRLFIISGIIGAAILIAVLALPWWLGTALAWIGPGFGATFRDYRRLGYERFRLEAADFRRGTVHVHVDNVEADTPLVWLWRRATGKPDFIVAGKWLTEVEPRKTEVAAKTEPGWVPLRQLLERIAGHLARWLPRARTGDGVVTWNKGRLEFGPATWDRRTLDCAMVRYGKIEAAAKLEMPDEAVMRLALTTPDRAGVALLESRGAAVTGTVTWWEQRAEVAAHFGEQGWRPNDASLRAEHWEIAGERLKIGAAYARVRGNGEVLWQDGKLSAAIDAAAEPAEHDRAPPLAAKLRGHVDASGFVAESLDVDLPGVKAKLSEPVTIDRSGKLRTGASRFTFAGDLAKVPWFAGRGMVDGEGRIAPARDGAAMLDFSVTGKNLSVIATEFSLLDIHGRFEWPRLQIDRARAATADGNELTWSGGLDFRNREVRDAVVRGRVSRRVLSRWIPENLKFETLTIAARASGPWREIVHDGNIQSDSVQLGKLKPFATELKWRGKGLTVENFSVDALAGKTKIAATGSFDQSALELKTLTLTGGETTRLWLAQPVAFHWHPWKIDQLHLAGTDAQIDAALALGETGQIDLAARHIPAEWLRDLFVLPPTVWTLDALVLNAKWAKGPANYFANADVTVNLGGEREAHVSTQLHGADDGLEITSLRVAEGSGEIAKISGHLPIIVRPFGRSLVEIQINAPISFDAATSPNPSFWGKLTQLTGLEIVNPKILAHVRGTLAEPRGDALLQAERLAAEPGRFPWPWPKIEGLDVHLTGDSDGVKLERFSVKIEDQAVRAHGSLPVSAARWGELLSNPRAFVRHGELRIEVPDAEMAAIARYVPEYLAPKGRLQLDLTLKSDATINGFVRVHDGTSRPLGPLGVLQEINANVRFEGRAANLESVTARMGGQLITLQGTAELLEREKPRLELRLQGENLPFVRQTGLLVRGDLDLKLATAESGRTSISGTVRLRDSLFLSDLRSLIPNGAKEAERRPPYFSIEAKPLNAWRLDVMVTGEKFLLLRTPVFNGTASTRVRLGGTLGSPHATGEAIIDEGNVRLPFASFEVKQGEVRLTPEHPEPQLLVTGTTRRYGYDLRMEVTGAASAPVVTFTSSPPLESEEVLLMIMAGQPPHNEISTTDRQRFARIGAYLGQSLLGSLGGDTTSADRLTISSGENISEQGRETYNIEYRLGARWSVTGEYDEFDEYYGGLKWRIYQKGGKKSDARE